MKHDTNVMLDQIVKGFVNKSTPTYLSSTIKLSQCSTAVLVIDSQKQNNKNGF